MNVFAGLHIHRVLMLVNIGCVNVPGGLALAFHKGFHENLKSRQVSTSHCKRTKKQPHFIWGTVAWSSGAFRMLTSNSSGYMSCFIFKKEKIVFITMFWVVVFYL